MKRVSTILILTFSSLGFSQTEVLQKIIISQLRWTGENNSPRFGYEGLYCERQLEYCLGDSTFKKRKNIKRPLKELKIAPSSFFTNPSTYLALDSLYQNFTNSEFALGKTQLYRVELVYAISKNQLPAKIKAMEFYISNEPRRQAPVILQELIKQYNSEYYHSKARLK